MTLPHLLTGEVAPAGPALGGVAVAAAALFTFLAFLVCAGLRQAWAATIGYGLRWIANEIRGVEINFGWFGSVHPFGLVADAFESIDHLVAHALAVAALNCQHAATYLWHTAAHIFEWTGQEIARLARDTLGFATGIYSHTLPKWKREILHAARHALHAGLSDVRHWVRHGERDLHRAIEAALTRALHAVHAVAGTLDHVIPRVHGLERDFHGLRARIKRLERLLAPGALVALIGATVFQHFGLEWLRCKSNPFRNNRNACGLWSDLAGLLGLVTAVLVAEDFEALVRQMQALEGEAINVAEDLFHVG